MLTQQVVAQTPGFVGADLENVLNEAALNLQHDVMGQGDASDIPMKQRIVLLPVI